MKIKLICSITCFVIGMCLLVFCNLKYIKRPNSSREVIDNLINQNEYSVIKNDTKETDYGREYYFEFANGVNFKLFACKDLQMAKKIFRSEDTESVAFRISNLQNVYVSFKYNREYVRLWKYHTKNEDFVVKIYSNNKKQLKEFVDFYLTRV